MKVYKVIMIMANRKTLRYLYQIYLRLRQMMLIVNYKLKIVLKKMLVQI